MIIVHKENKIVSVLLLSAAIIKKNSFTVLRYLLALLLLFSVSVIIIFTSENKNTVLPWPGWVQLVLPEGTEVQAVEKELKNAGISDFVSIENSSVYYMSVPDVSESVISNIDKLLIDRDPRKDFFLKNIKRLFYSGRNQILYVKKVYPVSFFHKLLTDKPELRKIKIAGYSGISEWKGSLSVFFILFSAAAGFILRRNGFKLFPPTVFFLLWFILFTYSSYYMFLPVFLFYIFSTYLYICVFSENFSLMKNTVTVLFLITGAAFFVFSAVSYIMLGGGKTELALVLAAVIAGGVLMRNNLYTGKKQLKPKSVNFSLKKLRKREHNLFEPVPLSGFSSYAAVKGNGGKNRISAVRPVFVLSIVLSVFLFFNYERNTDDALTYNVPGPEKSSDGFGRFSSYYDIFVNHPADRIPDVSDLLASYVYQSGFMYGEQYRIPLPGEKLETENYSFGNNKITAEINTVKVYNQNWLDDFEKNVLDKGIGSLFFSPGGPSVIVEKPAGSAGKPENDSPAMIFLYIAIVLMLIFSLIPLYGFRRVSTDNKYLTIIRRRDKAA